MRKALKITAVVLGVFFALIGWAIWSLSGSAPRLVRVAYDETVHAFSGYDFETRCIRRHDGYTVYGASPDCRKYGPSQSFQGIYIDEFEGQQFIDGARPSPVYRAEENIWVSILSSSDISAFGEKYPDELTGSRIWLVQFTGRKSTRNAAIGHGGMFDAEILVERIESAELLHEYEGYVPQTVLVREY